MSGPGVALGIVAYALFLIGVVTASALWSRRRLRHRLDAMMVPLAALGARELGHKTTGGLYPVASAQVELANGRQVHLSASYASRGFIRHAVRFDAGAGALPHITFTRENAFDRAGKRLGLTVEFQTGDRAFDQEVYIDTRESDDTVRRALARTEVRKAVRNILAAGHRVVFSSEGVEASKASAARGAFSPDHLPAILDCVRQVVDALPQFVAGPPRRAPIRRRNVAMAMGVVLGLTVGASAATMAGFGNRLLDATDLGWALAAGVLAWLGGVTLVTSGLRGRSDSHRVLAWVGGLGLVAVPLLVAGACVILNQVLDDGPAQVHQSHVVEVRNQRKTHEVVVVSWRAGHTTERLRLRLTVLRTLRAGDSLVVRVHPGALGWPWFELVAPSPPP